MTEKAPDGEAEAIIGGGAIMGVGFIFALKFSNRIQQ